MATDVFKGGIKIGAISAKFMSDSSNVDSDLLVASYADVNGGNVQTPHEVVAPGGAAAVSVNAIKKGLLEILVVTGHEDESGRLQVSHDGAVHDDEPTKGPVRWVFAVQE